MMVRWEDQVLDEYRRPVAGALVYVFTSDGLTLVALTDDIGLPLANPVETDSFGMFYFNVAASGTYQLEIHYAGETEYKQTIYAGTFGVPDGSITTPKLADGAVTTPKLADGAVTLPKLGFGSFTAANPGLAPASGGGGVNFLRADGTWGVPPGIATNAVWGAITGTLSAQTDLQTALNGKADAATTTAALATKADANNVVNSFNTRKGAVTLLSADVTAALGFTPANAATPQVDSFNTRTGAVTLTSGDVTTALTFTPASTALVSTSAAGLAPTRPGGTTAFLRADGTWAVPAGGGGGSGVWGAITGTLSDQTDLQAALNGKANLAGGNNYTGAQNFTLGSGNLLQAGTAANGVTAFGDDGNGAYINMRPAAGKSGRILFTENAVADRWVLGTKAGDSAFYFVAGGDLSGAATLKLVSGGVTIKGSGGNYPLTIDAGAQTNVHALEITNAGNGIGGIGFNSSMGGIVTLCDLTGPNNDFTLYAANRSFRFEIANNAFAPSTPYAFIFNQSSGAGREVIRVKNSDAGGTGDFLNFRDSTDAVKARIKADGGAEFVGAVTLPAEAYGGTWAAKLEAPTKKDVYDKIQTLGGGGTTTNPITWNNGGAGAASGATFNGSAAVTVSYNTIGAAPLASPTFTGKVTPAASAAGSAGFNLPPGAAPSAPANGDMWTTSAGVFHRVNGATVQVTMQGLATGSGLTMATARLLGRTTAATGAIEELTAAAALTFVGAAPAFVAIGAQSTNRSAVDADNNTHIVFSGAGRTFTLGTPTTGCSFTGRFTTAWSLAIAGGLSKNGAAPAGITTGSIAANSLITFLHEGAGVWVASGVGLT